MGIYSHLLDLSFNIVNIPIKHIYKNYRDIFDNKFSFSYNYKKYFGHDLHLDTLNDVIDKNLFIDLCFNNCTKIYGYLDDDFKYVWKQILKTICDYNNTDYIISYFFCSDYNIPFYFKYTSLDDLCSIFKINDDNYCLFNKNIIIDNDNNDINIDYTFNNNLLKLVIEKNYQLDINLLDFDSFDLEKLYDSF